MKITKNRGMYLETIINNSLAYYDSHNIALFRKQSIPIKIKRINKKEVIGILEDKCDVDYYGIYKGRFIALEAKQTNNDFFSLNQLLEHQKEYLTKIIKLGGLSYLIIFFQKTNNFYLVKFQNLIKIYRLQNNKKRIYENTLIEYSYKLELFFPGWIDFIKKIEL